MLPTKYGHVQYTYQEMMNIWGGVISQARNIAEGQQIEVLGCTPPLICVIEGWDGPGLRRIKKGPRTWSAIGAGDTCRLIGPATDYDKYVAWTFLESLPNFVNLSTFCPGCGKKFGPKTKTLFYPEKYFWHLGCWEIYVAPHLAGILAKKEEAVDVR